MIGYSGDQSTGRSEEYESDRPAGGAATSLPWLDDPAAIRLALVGSRRRRPVVPWSLLLGATAVVVVLVGFVAILAFTRDGPEAGDPMTATLSCPPRRDGTVIVGNGPGSVRSGAEAILGFQHAFYTRRSGLEARTFVAPDATNVSTAETIQRAIDTVIPLGTAYCVWIAQVTSSVYDVDLAEHRPDGRTSVYQQRVTTVVHDGQHLIHSVDDR